MATNDTHTDPTQPAPSVSSVIPPSAIRDQRVAPSGVLPRRLQTWLMAGTAVVVLLIILLTGHTTDPRPQVVSRPVNAAPAPADRIRTFAQQLVERAARDQDATVGRAGTPPAAPSPATESASRTSTSANTVADDTRKREAQSLFADNVVFSRRPAAEQPPIRSTGSSGSSGSAGAAGMAAPARAFGQLPANPAALNAQLAMLEQAVAQLPTATTAAAARAGAAETVQTSGAAQALGPAMSSPALSSWPTETPAVVPQVARPAAAVPVRSMAPERKTQETPAEGPRLRIVEGTVIETVLLTRLNGTLAGPVACLVTTPVYSEDRQHVLIPAGARVLGVAAPVQTWGDSRLAVSFHRLLMPDGHTYSLDGFHGLDQVGEAGVTEDVNRHYLQIFGASAAIGALSGLAQFGTTSGLASTSFGDQYRQAAGASLASSTSRILDRYLNVLPTITIREGYRIKVYLTADFDLPAYVPAIDSGGVR
jgi:type IV secretory pathway VirB10-like protein